MSKRAQDLFIELLTRRDICSSGLRGERFSTGHQANGFQIIVAGRLSSSRESIKGRFFFEIRGKPDFITPVMKRRSMTRDNPDSK
jgi:hypothetical protein